MILTFKSHEMKMANFHFLLLISVTSKRASWFHWLFCNFQVVKKTASLVGMLVLTWWNTWFRLLCKLPPTRKVDLQWEETKNTFNKMIKITLFPGHRIPTALQYLSMFLVQNNCLERRKLKQFRWAFIFSILEHNK